MPITRSIASASAAGRYPDDPGLRRLLADLRAGSAEFRDLWTTAEAGTWRSLTKTVQHPSLGEVLLDCDTLHLPDADQILFEAQTKVSAAQMELDEAKKKAQGAVADDLDALSAALIKLQSSLDGAQS